MSSVGLTSFTVKGIIFYLYIYVFERKSGYKPLFLLLRTPITSRLLSPGRAASPSVRRRHASEMSNPEFALFMEKEHLRGAEEDDYIIMENLIQRR